MSNHDSEQLDRIERRQVETIQLLLSLQRRIDNLTRTEIKTMSKLDDVTTHIQGLEDAQQSAITLLGTISAALKDAGGDPAKIDAIISRLDADKTAMAAAVVANTPADPNAGSGAPTAG